MKALREIKAGMLRGIGFLFVVLLGSALTFVAAQQITTFSAGDLVSATSINANFANLKAEAALKPPVGSIVAWHNGIAGVPVLPDGWLQCDGTTVNDPASALHGQVLPDLNGAGRFLRGSNTAGTLQADELRSHSHQQTTGACCAGFPNGIQAQTHAGQFGSTLNTMPFGGSETRPINMSVIWIIRIK